MSPFVYFRVIRFVPRNYRSLHTITISFFTFHSRPLSPRKHNGTFYIFTHLYVIDIVLNWTSHIYVYIILYNNYIILYIFIYVYIIHLRMFPQKWHDPTWPMKRRGISWAGPPSSPTWFFASPWPSAWHSTDPCGARWVFWEPSWARWSRHWNPGKARPPPRRMGCWGCFFLVE